MAKTNIAAVPATPLRPAPTNSPTSAGEKPAANAASTGTPMSATTALTRLDSSRPSTATIVANPMTVSIGILLRRTGRPWGVSRITGPLAVHAAAVVYCLSNIDIAINYALIA